MELEMGKEGRWTRHMGWRRVTLTVLFQVVIALQQNGASDAFVSPAQHHHHPHASFQRSSLKQQVPLGMVRNIDLPEAVVFYGKDSFVVPTDDGGGKHHTLRDGVDFLLQECRDTEVSAVLLLEPGESVEPSTYQDYDLITCEATHSSPNPRSLLEVLESFDVKPKGFGGSSGFGRKPAEYSRPPLSKYTAVLATKTDQCRAARYVGTRTLCLEENDIADAVLFEWDEIGCIEDISTPGSYWLNPPPGSRDDEGNKVDVYEVMEHYEGAGGKSTTGDHPEDDSGDEGLSEDDLNRILADIAPL